MIPTQQELRKAIRDRATEMTHPTKVLHGRKGAQRDHGYGKVVYFEGGHVGVLVDGRYLVAEGDDHQDSILALARYLGVTGLDNGVVVTEVSAGHFWLRCAAGR